MLFLLACQDTSLSKFNTPPGAEILSPTEGASAYEGDTISLRGAASDTNDAPDRLLVYWLQDGVELCSGAPDSSGITTCEAIAPALDTVFRLEVHDPSGETATDQLSLTVTPNTPPTVSLQSPTDTGRYYAEQLIPFQATVADNEDSALNLQLLWESSLDGVLSLSSTPDSEGIVLDAGYLSEGEHFISLTVTDSGARQAKKGVVIEVLPPDQAPSCEILTPADGSVGEAGMTVAFTGLAADPEQAADSLQVSWSSDKDGALGNSIPDSSGNIGFAWSALSINTHQLTMQVIDEAGASCTDSIRYTVGTPPTIMVSSPSSGSVVNEGELVAFLAEVADNESPAADLLVRWESDTDGILEEAAPDSTGLSAFYEPLSRGNHILTVTVTDADGLSASVLLPLNSNGLPDAPGVSLSPASPKTDDAISVFIDSPATDPENDPVSYGCSWYVNGLLSSASTTSTLPASATTKGETWTVEVLASDPYGSGGVGSASVLIGNTAPELTTVSISPVSPTASDSLLCSWSGFNDADGDSDQSTISWSINGVEVGTGTSLSGVFAAGDEVFCTVTPFDGEDPGTAVSASVIIAGGAPAVSSVMISPDPAWTDDTLSASVSASDPEGDAIQLSYAWYVNGSLVASTETLDPSYFERDDAVYVTVTPDDGALTGAPFSSSTLIISNSLPSAPVLAIDPASPVAGDELLCEISTGSTDLDNDAISYTFSWYLNGSSYSTPLTTSWPDDTIAGADVVEGDTWTCMVTPDDGTDFGADASISVTIGVASACPGGNCALRFNGSNSYVAVPHDASLNGGGQDLTVEAWVWYDSVTSNCMTTVRKGTASSPTYDYWLHKNWSPGDSLFWGSWTGFTVLAFSAVSPGQWYHYAGVYDGGSASIYLNGSLMSTASPHSTPTANSDELRIGIDWDMGCAMLGVIDEVRISNIARYTSSFSPSTSFSTDSNTMALWHFDEYTGSVAYDSSGNGNDGTIYSAAWTTEHP